MAEDAVLEPGETLMASNFLLPESVILKNLQNFSRISRNSPGNLFRSPPPPHCVLVTSPFQLSLLHN